MKFLKSLENQTLLAILLAIACGIYFSQYMISLGILGDMFIRLLKMVIMPLIFVSVFMSVAGLGSMKKLRDMGIKVFVYYTATTSLAVIVGLVLVNLIEPGSREVTSTGLVPSISEFSLKTLVLDLIPSNPVKSFVEGKVLQVIFFALLLGLATLSLNEQSRQTLSGIAEALHDALITLTGWIITLTPLGVFFIVAALVAEKGLDPLLDLWDYVITVILGLVLHAAVILGFLCMLLGRINPLKYFLQVREAVLVALSTASSSATLPVSMEVAEKKAGVPKTVAGFVLPLGATINMDGTALYEAVAAVFIANLYNVDLSFIQQVTVFLTAVLASVGAAGIPSAGLVTMALVLQSVGLPLEGIGLILAVDRFLDMLRTSVNVWGDLVGTRIIWQRSS